MADDPRRLNDLVATIAGLRRQLDDLQNTALNRLATHTHAGGGGGVTDHGALTGLGDDDHTQYHNDTRGDARYYTKTLSDAAYQPKDADLTTIAGLTPTTDNFLQAKASAWASRTPLQVATDLSAFLQPLDADLTAIAALSPSNGTFIKRAGGVWTAANIVPSDVTQTGVGATLMAYCTADTSRTSSTTLLDVPGISFTLEANSTYAADGFLAWVANTTGDIKFNWSGPSGFGGLFGIFGPATDREPIVGSPRINYLDTGVFSPNGNTFNATGDVQFATVFAAGLPHGYITTGATAGTFKLRFAQNTSNGTATTIKAGSWMRLVRMA